MSALILYHAGCQDGMMAAAIALDALRSDGVERIDLAPVSYGRDKVADFNIGDYQEVFILDFSFRDDDDLELLAEYEGSLYIFDHHRSAKVALDEMSLHPSCKVVYDQTRSGAGITWDEFYPNDERPLAVELVEDRDLWVFDYSVSGAFYLACRVNQFGVDDFVQMLQADHDLSNLVEEGKAYLRFMDAVVKDAADGFQVITTHQRLKVAIVPFNSYLATSEVLNYVCKNNPDIDVAVARRIRDGKVEFSARSIKGLARRLAESYGGGGHDNAAGWTSPMTNEPLGLSTD